MNTFEHLEDEACKDGIDVVRRDFTSERIKGLYCNGTIALNTCLKTTPQKTCVLLEEMGHHFTSVGDILDLSDAHNRKQERQARIWAYNKQIGLYGLIRAYEKGCNSRHEIADFLEVTEEFLEDAIYYYREKYGVCASIDNYVVYFIPYLMIFKKL